jgi:hypothetical protein
LTAWASVRHRALSSGRTRRGGLERPRLRTRYRAWAASSFHDCPRSLGLPMYELPSGQPPPGPPRPPSGDAERAVRAKRAQGCLNSHWAQSPSSADFRWTLLGPPCTAGRQRADGLHGTATCGRRPGGEGVAADRVAGQWPRRTPGDLKTDPETGATEHANRCHCSA